MDTMILRTLFMFSLFATGESYSLCPLPITKWCCSRRRARISVRLCPLCGHDSRNSGEVIRDINSGPAWIAREKRVNMRRGVVTQLENEDSPQKQRRSGLLDRARVNLGSRRAAK